MFSSLINTVTANNTDEQQNKNGTRRISDGTWQELQHPTRPHPYVPSNDIVRHIHQPHRCVYILTLGDTEHRSSSGELYLSPFDWDVDTYPMQTVFCKVGTVHARSVCVPVRISNNPASPQATGRPEQLMFLSLRLLLTLSPCDLSPRWNWLSDLRYIDRILVYIWMWDPRVGLKLTLIYDLCKSFWACIA